MKKSFFKQFVHFFLISGLLLTACKKDNQDNPNPNPNPEPIPSATAVNSFIWNGLHDYYLWTSQVDGLENQKYRNKDTLNLMLNRYSDPQKLFDALLYKHNQVDKWSFLVDDAKAIDDWISGTSKTMGFDFMLTYIGSSNDLFGFVRYVYAGSPAEEAGMKRGDLFLTVNGEQLNVSNYSSLLFDLENYTLGFATIANQTIKLNGKTVTMTAVEMQENPINKDTIFTYENQKIGYLVYNGFNADFDVQLNDVFGRFRDAGINQLVVDLRYNGGGSVQSSIYLASMIYGTDTKKIFAESQYNSLLQDYLIQEYGESALLDYFTPTIEATDTHGAIPINTLSMRKVYFIVSDNTASASELLINGLRPYMDVKVIGINTVGKYTGSMTIKDWDENGVVNPAHNYAMQPIVVKYANSQGVTDFVDGLTPDIVAEEDIADLLPFGDPNEQLLHVVLNDIKGIASPAMSLKSAQMGFRKAADSHDFKPFANEMYINPFRQIKKKLK